jgi:hypothetical protein
VGKDEEMMQALRQRRGPPRALVLSGIGAALLLGVVVVLALGRGEDRASRAFSRLSRCLIGDPLGEGENVFFRIREVELGEKVRPSGSGDSAWPARCAPHATELYRAIDGSGRTALLQRLLREQLGCGDSESQPCRFEGAGQPLTKADETWNAAALAGLELVDVPELDPPKTRLRPALGRELPSLGTAEHALADHRFTEGGELWLLLRPAPRAGDTGRTTRASFRFCRITASGEKASCADAPALPRSLRDARLLADDRAPAVHGYFQGDGGEERGAFSLPGGAPLKTRHDLRHGAALEQRGDGLYLLEIAGGLVTAQNKLDLPKKAADASVLFGSVGWLELDQKAGTRKLRFRTIAAGASLDKAVVELEGEVPARLEPCAAAGGGVLYGRSGEPPEQLSWFRGASGWSRPVSGSLPTGQRREWTAICSPDRLTRNWVVTEGEQPVLGLLDCSPKACRAQHVAWKGEPVKQWLALAQLGDSALALYESFESDKRLRLAPVERIAETDPVVLIDGFEYSGPKFENARVLIGSRLVAVVFDDEKDLHVLYVNADGKYGAVGQ